MKTLMFTVIIAMLTGALLMTGGMTDKRYRKLAVTHVADSVAAQVISSPTGRGIWRYNIRIEPLAAGLGGKTETYTLFYGSGDSTRVTWVIDALGGDLLFEYNGPPVTSIRAETEDLNIKVSVYMWY